jgi:hypothetical protein
MAFTCSKEQPLSPAGAAPGSANLTIDLGAVGSIAKRSVLSLDTLTIKLTAVGENPIIDLIQIGGSGRHVVTRSFSGLAPRKTWTVTAETKDKAGAVIHSGVKTFAVEPGGVAEVTLALAARYSTLKASFFPKREGARECAIYGDGMWGYSDSFGASDTVTLCNGYLDASPQGTRHFIRMEVRGGALYDYQPLYRADTVITVVSGENASFRVTLKYLLTNPRPGEATMIVVLGAVGGVTVDGEMEGRDVPVLLYVDSAAAAGGDGLSWRTAIPDLHDALELAETVLKTNPRATVDILIAEGTYFPSDGGDSTASFYLRDNVRILGGFPKGGGARAPSNTTILSGAKGSIHILRAVDVGPTAIVEGVTVSEAHNRAGGGAGMWCLRASPKVLACKFTNNSSSNCMDCDPVCEGGAVFDSLSSPEFDGCSFSGCWSDRGGAIFNANSSPLIVHCTFTDNGGIKNSERRDLGGGGICNVASSPRIEGCTFINNRGVVGGAVTNASRSSSVIIGCVFKNNFGNEFQGGAIANYESDPLISDCIFVGNTAGDGGGGGIFNEYASPRIMRCSFSGNRLWGNWTWQGGGGVSNRHSSSPVITNCTFDSNVVDRHYGGAICDFDVSSSTIATNCTFTRNSAEKGGAYYGAGGVFTNCIFWGDSVTTSDYPPVPPQPSELSSGTSSVQNCIVFGGYPGGIFIIDQNPILGPLADNGGAVPTCAIPFESPAKDAGTPTVPIGVDISKDARGMPRSGGKPDIGAYEVQ